MSHQDKPISIRINAEDYEASLSNGKIQVNDQLDRALRAEFSARVAHLYDCHLSFDWVAKFVHPHVESMYQGYLLARTDPNYLTPIAVQPSDQNVKVVEPVATMKATNP